MQTAVTKNHNRLDEKDRERIHKFREKVEDVMRRAMPVVKEKDLVFSDEMFRELKALRRESQDLISELVVSGES
ncbi:hypothetical protein DXG01_014333 [Tephrocybe rancida]|nr:hypothetical protein DXG01_014333 [Tephrocybe rancida]